MKKEAYEPRCHRIGSAEQISERGAGLRFDIDPDEFVSGFVVRFEGKLYAYRNQCPHVGSELDWVFGQFFDQEKQYLTCATHGALFEPGSGKCVKGPCQGQSLSALSVKCEDDDVLVWF